MNRHQFSTFARYPLIAAALVWGHGLGTAPRAFAQSPTAEPAMLPAQQRMLHRVTNAQRAAAAAAMAAERKAALPKPSGKGTAMSLVAPQAAIMAPNGVPDYMGGVVPNWALSPTTIRKFVDTLPGLT